jgi:hypothetical protein
METIDLGNGNPNIQNIQNSDSVEVPVSLEQIHVETSDERCEFSQEIPLFYIHLRIFPIKS